MIQCQLNWKARTPVRAFAMSKPSTRKKIINDWRNALDAK